MPRSRIALALLIASLEVGLNLPVASAQRGAHKMPYVRYEANAGKYAGGAELRGPSFDQDKVESEASERVYVALPQPGSHVEWTMQKPAEGITLRFTMPDAADGTGLSGKLTLYVNDQRVREILLTSYHSWQYFDKTESPRHPHNDPKHAKGVGSSRMRFDEVRFRQKLGQSDRIRLQKDVDDGIEYGIDFIEVEAIPPAIPKPDGFLDVTTFGKDHAAFAAAIQAGVDQGKGVYIPPGRYEIGDQLTLDHDQIRIQGAGIWYTELYFTATDKRRGGIYGTGSKIHIRDLFLDSKLNKRDGYRAFGQHWGSGSTIENIWLTHFSVGFWVGHYATKTPGVADGLTVRNCRIRNTYADGLNFAKGSRNCVVEHCSVRNTGDDGIATWSSDGQAVTSPTWNNTIRFNTIEHVMRAAGIGIFGGGRHTVQGCLVIDSFAGPGIRVNSVFPGHPFADSAAITVSDCAILRCGTRSNMFGQVLGAIDLEVKRYDVQHVIFKHIEVIDSQVAGILVHGVKNKPAYKIHDVYFDDVRITGTGKDGRGSGYGIQAQKRVTGWIQKQRIEFADIKGQDVSVESRSFKVKDGPLP